MTNAGHEFAILRETIARRGTVRVVLAVVTICVWATLALIQALFSRSIETTVFPFAVLAVGFEAIHALHTGVERVGRYLQVFYEETASNGDDVPRWETTAMRSGPTLPGGGVDPLFSVLFVSATVLNFGASWRPRQTAIELVIVGVIHILLVGRIVLARLAAAHQRSADLAHYRHLRDTQ
jgi:hypothetical protein